MSHQTCKSPSSRRQSVDLPSVPASLPNRLVGRVLGCTLLHATTLLVYPLPWLIEHSGFQFSYSFADRFSGDSSCSRHCHSLSHPFINLYCSSCESFSIHPVYHILLDILFLRASYVLTNFPTSLYVNCMVTISLSPFGLSLPNLSL